MTRKQNPATAQATPPDTTDDTVHLDDSRICNASMRDTTYRTGDGEVIQQPRLGSLRAFTLPSRGFST